MKKQLLTSSLFLLSGLMAFGQTAVNFTGNDCAGASHTLFTELEAGKVIVITFVMPCGSCITPASQAATTAKGYASSNPGRVKFYLADDLGDTPCNTLNSWASTNSITPDASFSLAAFKMSDYGSTGMNRTIVLGGTSHTIYYNVTGNNATTTLQTAINNALASTSGIIENNNSRLSLSVFPSPVINDAKIAYNLSKSSDVSISVLNVLGEKVNKISLGTQSAGKQEYQINVGSLSKGVYFIKLSAGEVTETTKISVVH